MRKLKSRSMQRGAAQRDFDPDPVTNEELYRQSPPLITGAELVHFGGKVAPCPSFLNQFRKFRYVSLQSQRPAKSFAQSLNKAKRLTFVRSPWTPRPAWFLKKFLSEIKDANFMDRLEACSCNDCRLELKARKLVIQDGQETARTGITDAGRSPSVGCDKPVHSSVTAASTGRDNKGGTLSSDEMNRRRAALAKAGITSRK